MTPFEICKAIRNSVIRTAAEVATYTTWSPEFAVNQLRELSDSIKQRATWFSPINPNDLTKAEMVELGFHRWSEKNPMMLIPMWLLPYLVDSFEGGVIGEEPKTETLITSLLDSDNRGGLLAYGVYKDA